MDITDFDFMREKMTKVVDNIHMYEEYIQVYEERDKDGNRKPSGTPGMYFVNMIDDGLIDRKEVYHLGDIVRGIAPARVSDDQIFLVSLGGMPILDVGWGYECYKKAQELNIGTKLKVWDTPYLIWPYPFDSILLCFIGRHAQGIYIRISIYFAFWGTVSPCKDI